MIANQTRISREINGTNYPYILFFDKNDKLLYTINYNENWDDSLNRLNIGDYFIAGGTYKNLKYNMIKYHKQKKHISKSKIFNVTQYDVQHFKCERTK